MSKKKRVVVRVSDIIDYLQKNFKLDAKVYLDKDGWCEDEINPKNAEDLISQSNVFNKFKGDLFINN